MSEFPIDKLEILKRKDSCPFEWVDSYKKFIYPRLPPKESFYSSIDDGKRGKGNGYISAAQYLHLKLVWRKFEFKTLKGYHDHYLKKDVLLLADVFEKFCLYQFKVL